eukprot:1188468-Prorocentrum_minimum.AAC.1
MFITIFTAWSVRLWIEGPHRPRGQALLQHAGGRWPALRAGGRTPPRPLHRRCPLHRNQREVRALHQRQPGAPAALAAARPLRPRRTFGLEGFRRVKKG